MKKIITVTGPSGSGKDTLVDATLAVFTKTKEEIKESSLSPLIKDAIASIPEKHLSIREIISHTTRKPRIYERNGVDYYFVSEEKFADIPKVEETIYSGNHYGISKAELDAADSEYGIVIVDRVGVKMIEDYVGKDNIIKIFIKTPVDEIASRMRARGDSEENIALRLEYLEKTDETSSENICDYVVSNIDLETAVRQMIDVIETAIK